MDYAFEALDPERFQQFAQALLAREHKNIKCFPVGQPDGGRDAVGPLSSGRQFNVFQVKFVRNPNRLEDVVDWLAQTIEAEKKKVERLKKAGAQEYFLITNTPGTAHFGAGSIDKLDKLLQTLPLPAHCWWRDDISRRLDSAWDLKWVYPELMSGQDLIRAFVELALGEHQERRATAIRAFLQDQLTKDSVVKFKQVELQNRLLDLFVDLPVSPPRSGQRRLFHAIRNSMTQISRRIAARSGEDRESDGITDVDYAYPDRETPIGAATMFLSGAKPLSRLVLEGAPGQGKSTITQYICQVHRMRLLEAVELIHLPPEHRQCPVKLPFRIDLRDFATWLERKNPFTALEPDASPPHWHKSLEAFLAAQVRFHAGGVEFAVNDLLAVTKLSPVLLVFDGLDEVAQIKRRQEVVEEVLAGIKRLEANTLELQVIVTSRPAAFANSPGMPQESFPYFELGDLPRNLINDYSEKWITARRLGSTEARDVRQILKEKLDTPHLKDLARNPMQLAILLSLIHTRGASLPDKRTALYDAYVELFFNREAEKSTVVREHRYLLINIHQYLAWHLHVRAEAGSSGGSITEAELLSSLRSYLSKEGHNTELAAQLFFGMIERVVAIVSRVEGTYEFEVQPLREYFAARYLYETAPYSPPGNERLGTKPDRFMAMAKNFYWLNVARFYAGCYSVGELPSLIDNFGELIESEDFRYLSHPRVLGAMLLSDWVFNQHPRSVKQLSELIFDSLGLKFASIDARNRRSQAFPMPLPPGGGREQLLQRCFGKLKSARTSGYALDVASVIRRNEGADLFFPLWLEVLRGRLSIQRKARWLRVGLSLGFLARIDSSMLDECSDALSTPIGVAALIHGHRTDWLLADANRVANALQLLLTRRIAQQSIGRGGSWFEVLARYINPSYLYVMGHAPSAMPLLEGMREFNPHVRSNDERAHWSDNRYSALIGALETELARPLAEWATSLAPSTAFVELLRREFGDMTAVIHFAIVCAGVRSQKEQCTDASEIFDPKIPLSRRARYARLRAGNAAWWTQNLNAVSADCDLHFLLESLLVWCSPNVLSQLLEQIDAVLTSVSQERWESLYFSVRDAIEVVLRAFGDVSNLEDYPSLRKLSARTQALLTLRSGPSLREKIYRRLRVDLPDDVAVIESCLSEAYREILSGSARWQPAAEVIEKAFSQAIPSPMEMQHVLERRARSEELDTNFCRFVLERADRFPASLVGYVESHLRQRVGKHAAPVGEIARRNGWFAAPASRSRRGQ